MGSCLADNAFTWMMSRAAGGRLTPAQEAKAKVYKKLAYRQAGMVGVNLAARPPRCT